jgi:hypothetical protein
MPSIEVMIPVVTVSEANGGRKRKLKFLDQTIYKGEHWTDKHKRHKKQKAIVRYFLNPMQSLLSIPCHVHLTRHAPNKLNKHDNLPMSLKYIVDAVCEVITQDFRPGRADDSDDISISYHQVVSKQYWVNIKIDM